MSSQAEITKLPSSSSPTLLLFPTVYPCTKIRPDFSSFNPKQDYNFYLLRQSNWNSKDPIFIAAIQWRTGLHPTWRPTNTTMTPQPAATMASLFYITKATNSATKATPFLARSTPQGDPRPGQQHRPKEIEPAAMASLICTKGDPNLATQRRPLHGHPKAILAALLPDDPLLQQGAPNSCQQLRPRRWPGVVSMHGVSPWPANCLDVCNSHRVVHHPTLMHTTPITSPFFQSHGMNVDATAANQRSRNVIHDY